MKINQDEPILLLLQQDPLAFVIQNASDKKLFIPLPAEAARELVFRLLSCAEVSDDFVRSADERMIKNNRTRPIVAVN
jgi:hypothetical protein